MTGEFFGRGCGTKTFTYRQSSDNCVFGFHISAPGKSPNTVSMIWTHELGRSVVFSTPDHFSMGRGWRYRNGPIGGWAYGMPRNISTFLPVEAVTVFPRIFPLSIAMTSGSFSSGSTKYRTECWNSWILLWNGDYLVFDWTEIVQKCISFYYLPNDDSRRLMLFRFDDVADWTTSFKCWRSKVPSSGSTTLTASPWPKYGVKKAS